MDDGDLRIGSAERDEALAALAEHHAAGRLDANDYEDRRGRAIDALVRRDLTSLFVDLPDPRPALVRGEVARATGTPARAKAARTLLSLAPFIALGAFFVTKSWLAFLLVPILAIVARNFDD